MDPFSENERAGEEAVVACFTAISARGNQIFRQNFCEEVQDLKLNVV
jgi:hypothetical protein